MQRPTFQFYPGDWQRDAGLRACSVGARGCWLEMICIMHQSEPYGHLRINGRALDSDVLSRMIGATPREVRGWLGELENAGVFARDTDGAIVSRRMVRDEDIRRRRAAGGKLGGNPALMDKEKVMEKVNLPPNLPPTPSSSSSSSSSEAPPLPPASGGRPRAAAITFATFLDRCKSSGEKAISEYEPLLRYAEQAQLPMEMVNLCWQEFKRRHTGNGSRSTKRQSDWRRTFLNAVEGNWYKFWWSREVGVYELTTAGIQAKTVHREAA